MKGENNPNFGKIWYNNGIEERFFSPDEEIPEGYFLGRKEETKKKSEARKIRVITPFICYFSMKDARKELGISINKFYKLFEKDPLTRFYAEKQK